METFFPKIMAVVVQFGNVIKFCSLTTTFFPYMSELLSEKKNKRGFFSNQNCCLFGFSANNFFFVSFIDSEKYKNQTSSSLNCFKTQAVRFKQLKHFVVLFFEMKGCI